jgi:hypothetical protein
MDNVLLYMALALPVAVGILTLFLWPLRVIVHSAKVRGIRKFLWVILWFVSFVLGAFAATLWISFLPRPLPSYGLVEVLLPVIVSLPIWLVHFLFRHFTQDIPDIASRAESIGFALGRSIKNCLKR